METDAPMLTDRELLNQVTDDQCNGGNVNNIMNLGGNRLGVEYNDNDRYEDDGESQDFSDTENEHFSAPGQIVQRTF